MDAPTTLLQAVTFFSDADRCAEYMIVERWPDGQVRCPQCDSVNVKYLPNAKLWKCYEKHSRQKFSLKVGTIFEDSPLSLSKWLPAVWLITNAKNGISSHELARALGVTQKTAWFMLHRIRLAMQTKTFTKMGGTVEADETYIGGKARNMHKGKRERLNMHRGRSMPGKVAVMGLLERHGKDGHSRVRTEILTGLRKTLVQGHVRRHVEAGAVLNTDAYESYTGLNGEYVHNVIDHAEKYVDGQVHTNGCENFWSLLKRAIKGTYVSVEPFHLFRYLDEQTYRFNERKADDAERFRGVLARTAGRRLMYADLIGKANAPA